MYLVNGSTTGGVPLGLVFCCLLLIVHCKLLCSRKSTDICTGLPLCLLVLAKEDEASLLLT